MITFILDSKNPHIFSIFLFAGEILTDLDSVKHLNAKSFSIKAIMTGGRGDCAWQHTQLFRQSINSDNEYPFELKIRFL